VKARDAFAAQADGFERAGSPFTARLCRMIAARSDAALAGIPFDAGDTRPETLPARFAAALHWLVLEDRDAGLSTVFPPNDEEASDADVWMAVAAAVNAHPRAISAGLAQAPRGGDPMVCGAFAPGFLTISALTGKPLALSQTDAGAGIDLWWDRYGYRFGPVPWGVPDADVDIRPDWSGPTPPMRPVRIAERAGCDAAPPDLARPAVRMRMLSQVPADRPGRLLRLAGALEIARNGGPIVEAADVTEWLTGRLSSAEPGLAHVVFHGAVGGGPIPEGREAMIRVAGAQVTSDAPLAWLRFEAERGSHDREIKLTLWPGGETRVLGRCDAGATRIAWRGWD
jgi:hypothetical protein